MVVRTEDRVFESLYRRNQPAVYAYALSLLRNSSDAEDVAQTTFLNAYTALHRGVTPRDELQWLRAIARNVCHDRFRSAKAVGRYFGLVPSQDQSGDKNRLGHITREGAPVVRQLVAEAAWQARRRSPTVRAYFERVQRGDPQRKKIALVATAHYLVRVMWSMLKHGTAWE